MKNKHKFLSFLMISACALVACASASRSVSSDNSNKNLFGANNEEEQVQNPVSFSSDNWSTICALANMGEEAFKEVYVPNGSLNDLIGTSREIEGIGEATLIDYSHDLNGKLNKTGLLTFQITAPIENIEYSTNGSNRWYLERSTGNIESNIRHYLNNDLFNALPNVIKDNIVVVRKKTLEYTASGIQYRNYTDEKIYPLSLSEYGIPPIDQRDTEGDVYRAYIYDDQTPRKVELPEATWLRSPSIALDNPDKVFCLTKTEEGEVVQAIREVGSPFKLVCAFTIGMQRETTTTFAMSHCKVEGYEDSKVTAMSGEKIELTLSPESRAWKLPGGILPVIPYFSCFFSYSEELGILKYRQPYINASIVVVADKNEFNLKINFTNISHNAPSSFICGNKVEIQLKPNNYYKLPNSISGFTFEGIEKNAVTYSNSKLTFIAPSSDITITANATKKTLEELTWSEISTISKTGKASDWCSVGTTKSLTVNGINQPVRVIGFNHDELADGSGKKAGITFEFVNLLSLSDGYSLASLWDRPREGLSFRKGINWNYFEYSNLNLACGSSGGYSTWFAFSKQLASLGSNYFINYVKSCLPESLGIEIKQVKKPIAIKVDDDFQTKFEIANYITEIFVLSYREMSANLTSSYAKEEGYTYAFYTGNGDTDANRIKHQPKWHDGALTNSIRIIDPICVGSHSYAGYNSSIKNEGAPYFLRSPYTDNGHDVWFVRESGGFSSVTSSDVALPIAPAFCI